MAYASGYKLKDFIRKPFFWLAVVAIPFTIWGLIDAATPKVIMGDYKTQTVQLGEFAARISAFGTVKTPKTFEIGVRGRDLASIEVGTLGTIKVGTGDTFEARVTELPVIKGNPVTDQGYPVQLEARGFPDIMNSIKNGSRIYAVLDGKPAADQIVIPSDAIYATNGRTYVKVIRYGNQIKPQRVFIGAGDNKNTVIRDGLEVGDKVVIWSSVPLEKLGESTQKLPGMPDSGTLHGN